MALPNAGAKKVNGTMRRHTTRKENDACNYEEFYPEDAPYQGTAPDVRVWRTYEDESKVHDEHGWRVSI
ncbi:hypothetical protein EDD85DRAFT_958744 [Armillaria nabsnona]|nr:hypothetical protein EDD85DRAFT_958744 [Armillaria nabsnona]